MVENPSDKFLLMYLLLEIIVLLVGVHVALNTGEDDVSEVILQKLKLFFLKRWVNIVMGGMCHVFQSWDIVVFGLNGTQHGQRVLQILLCDIWYINVLFTICGCALPNRELD